MVTIVSVKPNTRPTSTLPTTHPTPSVSPVKDGSKGLVRSVSISNPHSPRKSDAKSAPRSKHLVGRQKSESSVANGSAAAVSKPTTVEDIQQRHRANKLASQQQAQPADTELSPLPPPATTMQSRSTTTSTSHTPANRPVPNAQLPSPQPTLPPQPPVQGPASHKHPPPQHVKSKQQVAKGPHKSQGHPSQMQSHKPPPAPHKQPLHPPTHPPPQSHQHSTRHTTEQQLPLPSPKSHSSATVPVSAPSLSTRSTGTATSPVPSTQGPPGSVSSGQQSDESDGFSVNDALVGSGVAGRGDLLQVHRRPNSADLPIGNTNRGKRMFVISAICQPFLRLTDVLE